MSIPDITEVLPAVLSARQAAAAASSAGIAFDLSIAGIGLVTDYRENEPYRRESAPAQKDQLDISGEAGENALDGFWTRSQTSWHNGAGSAFYEPGSRDEPLPSKYRFAASSGVDVWSEGQATLLHAVDPVALPGAFLVSRDGAWWSLSGNILTRHDTADTEYPPSGATYRARMANTTDGAVIGAETGLYSVDQGTVAEPTLLWGHSTGIDPFHVKQRLVSIDTTGAVYALSAVTGGTIDSTHLIGTLPTGGGVVVEVSDAILYTAGSQIFASTVSSVDTGGVPTLDPPRLVAELPTTVHDIKPMLGRFLGIGTAAGFRVAVIDTNGRITYGPLLWDDRATYTVTVKGDSFYCACDTEVRRVSVANPLDDGLTFAWASDLHPTSGTVHTLGFRADGAMVVDGRYVESASYLSEGWLESGVVRFGTTANKVFRTVDIGAHTPGDTSVSLAASTGTGFVDLHTVDGGRPGLNLPLSLVPVSDSMSYRVTLRGDGVETPVVEYVTLKAVPSVPRRRFIQYPIVLDDRVQDRNRNPLGEPGYGFTVTKALEALESSETVVQVRDEVHDETFEATIEKVEYYQTQSYTDADGNTGGRGLVTVKTL